MSMSEDQNVTLEERVFRLERRLDAMAAALGERERPQSAAARGPIPANTSPEQKREINFGFDFNPVIDRIRVVSNTKKNYVLNPNDGSAVAVTDLFFGPADPNFGVSPNVEFSGYTNSTSPAPAATTAASAPHVRRWDCSAAVSRRAPAMRPHGRLATGPPAISA